MPIINDGKLIRMAMDEEYSKYDIVIDPFDLDVLCSFLNTDRSRELIYQILDPLYFKNKLLASLWLIYKHFYENKTLDIGTVTNELKTGLFGKTPEGNKINYPHKMIAINDQIIAGLPRSFNYETLKSVYEQRATEFRKARLFDNLQTVGLERALIKDREYEIRFSSIDPELEFETTMDNAKDNFIAHVERKLSRSNMLDGYKCWDWINDMMSGIRPGDMGIIAARPGTGKTMFAVQMALELSSKDPKSRPAILNMEMPRKQILQRMIQSFHNTTEGNLFKLTKEGIVKLMVDCLEETQIMITDHLIMPFEDIISYAEVLYDKGHRVFFVDYIQLAKVKDKKRDKFMVIEDAVTMQKNFLAKHPEAHFVNLAQIKRTDKKIPTIDDLRWCSYLEEAAAWVALLYDEKEKDLINSHAIDTYEEFKLNLDKNRHGATGIQKLYCNKARQIVTEIKPYGFENPVEEKDEDRF